MNRTKFLRFAWWGIVVILVLLSALIWFIQDRMELKETPIPLEYEELPFDIRHEHRDVIFRITWSKRQSLEYCDYLLMYMDGTISHLQMNLSRYSFETNQAHFDQDERLRIRRILRRMSHISSVDQPIGDTVGILSFAWDGENHFLPFDEVSCSKDVQRLFQLIDGALEYDPQRPHPCGDLEEQQQEQTQYQDNFKFSNIDDLPQLLNMIHNANLFHFTWFKEPYSDTYEQLAVSADSGVEYYQMRERAVESRLRGSLTEDERAEMQAILKSLLGTNLDSQQRIGDVIVSLSYIWKSDYRFFSFSEFNCHPDIQRLFVIAETALERGAGGASMDFQSPCK